MRDHEGHGEHRDIEGDRRPLCSRVRGEVVFCRYIAGEEHADEYLDISLALRIDDRVPAVQQLRDTVVARDRCDRRQQQYHRHPEARHTFKREREEFTQAEAVGLRDQLDDVVDDDKDDLSEEEVRAALIESMFQEINVIFDSCVSPPVRAGGV